MSLSGPIGPVGRPSSISQTRFRRCDSEFPLAVVDDADDDHRDAAGGGLVLEGLEHLPAVHPGEDQVEGDGHVVDNIGGGVGALPDEAMRARMAQHFDSL